MTYEKEILVRSIRSHHEDVPLLPVFSMIDRYCTDADRDALYHYGDTYDGMPLRKLCRLMSDMDFETTFEIIGKRRATFGFGRKRDAVVANFTFQGDSLIGASGAFSARSTSFIVNGASTVLLNNEATYSRKIGRMTFSPLNGMKLKLESFPSNVEFLPLWWSTRCTAIPQSADHKPWRTLLTTRDIDFLHSDSSSRALDTENSRRMAMLSDEWKSILDIEGTRLISEVLDEADMRREAGAA